ncbi:hypothetical protein Tco_1400685 [Tanacetum coccineum]
MTPRSRTVFSTLVIESSSLKIFSGKLKTHWTGPFTVTQVFPYGTIELSQTDGPNFKETSSYGSISESSPAFTSGIPHNDGLFESEDTDVYVTADDGLSDDMANL